MVVVVTLDVKLNTGCALFGQQFKGLVIKRMLNTWRSRVLTLSQITFPLFIIILAVTGINRSGSASSVTAYPDDPKINLDVGMFGSSSQVKLSIKS